MSLLNNGWKVLSRHHTRQDIATSDNITSTWQDIAIPVTGKLMPGELSR
jgi:hypothetical protein